MHKFKAIVFDHDGTLVDTTNFTRPLYPGIKEMLEKLTELGIEMYVWTARERRSLVEILQYLDIIGHFKMLSCGEEVPMKPSPVGIEEMLFEQNPAEVVVIGDSLADMQGGRKFGAFCIGAMWSHGQANAEVKYIEAGADKCFLTVDECLNFLIENIEDKNV